MSERFFRPISLDFADSRPSLARLRLVVVALRLRPVPLAHQAPAREPQSADARQALHPVLPHLSRGRNPRIEAMNRNPSDAHGVFPAESEEAQH